MTAVKGRLWIVAAPSGGGKTSLVEAAIAQLDNTIRSVSFTTRQQRVGEVDGSDYVFVSEEEFERLIDDGHMLEYEQVFGNYYGTSLAFINEHLDNGCDVILTIDWQGSRRVREMLPESRGIFILPPSVDALEERLRGRQQDNEDIIAARMAEAQEQISHYSEFDYVVLNDEFETALRDVLAILRSNRCGLQRQQQALSELISSLVS